MGGLVTVTDIQSIFFIATLLLLGLVFVVAHFLKHKRPVAYPLLLLLLLAVTFNVGILVHEIVQPTSPTYVLGDVMLELHVIYDTHRWLLLLLPLLLIVQSLVVLAVYRNHLIHAHARAYRLMFAASTAIAFGSLLLITLEGTI